MLFIGIDPGKSGALAVINEEGRICDLVPFRPTEYVDTLNKTRHTDKCFCCIEKVGAMPKQGVTSTFTFGENYGWLRGVLDTLAIPHRLCRPQEWKKEYGLHSDKAASIETCKKLFPGVVLHRTERCKTDDDNMAEALLLAEYARRTYETTASDDKKELVR